MELLVANIVYVSYRLVVSGPLVKLCTRWVPFYVAVLIMAQLSFVYDNVIFAWFFSATELPPLVDLFYADVIYTLRVLAAWWVIKQLWNLLNNYWLAVFLGAELTFAVDFFIFDNIVY